jgi:hypothetical protein
MIKKLRLPSFKILMFLIIVLPGCIKSDIGNDVSSNTNNIDIITGLIAYYPFNGSTNDESGNGNHGIGYGVILTKDRLGKDNNAYYFSGSNCDTRIEANIKTQSIKTGFTISFWMKSDLSKGCELQPTLLKFGNKNSDNGSRRISATRMNGVDYFVMNSSYGGDGYPYPINNEWRHITVTFDGNIENWYQNGTYIGSDKKDYFQPHLPGNAVFGRNNELFWLSTIYDTYKGSLDEIRIYDKVLNEEQIKYVSTL